MERITHYIPFMAMFSKNVIDYPLLTKLTENAIIGIASAFLTLYVSDKLQEQSLNQITKDIVEIKRNISEMRHDLYVPRNSK